MRHLDLFAGIGGFSLAASWVWPDHTPLAFCEKDAFCGRILAKHWPGVPIIEDIHDFRGSDYADVDLLTGGFPCQPFSSAGQRKGTEDDRHLWPEMLRAIREARPRYVVGENVPGLVTWNDGLVFDEVLSDLEAEGYEVVPLVIPACGVDAPHRRDRVWIVAHASRVQPGRKEQRPERERVRSRGESVAVAHAEGARTDAAEQPGQRRCAIESRDDVADAEQREGGERRDADLFGRRSPSPEQAWMGGSGAGGDGACGEPQPRLGRVDDGLPRWMDEPRGVPRVAKGIPNRTDRLKALGNAIVPQVAAQIFRALPHTSAA